MKKITIIAIFIVNITLGIFIASLFTNNEKVVNAQANVLSEKEMTGIPLQKNYNRIAKLAIPAIVSIQVEATIRDPYQNYANEFFRKFFGDIPESRQKTVKGFGSGFLISQDGYVVTNNHVIKNAEKITIFFSEEKKYSAEIVGKDEKSDIALLQIKSNNKFHFLKLGDSDKIEVGDIAVAIGNPFNLAHTFTTGVISAKGRSNLSGDSYIQNFIQSDVAINPGNSGGPLINLKGEVIGINTMILSPGNSGNIGIGFSIPINLAQNIIKQLKKNGKVERGYLGIVMDIITPEIAQALNLKSDTGVYIAAVEENSPAHKIGLKQGDIIISFNNKKIKHPGELINEVYSLPINKSIPIEVLRDGKKIKENITLGKNTQTNKTKIGNSGIILNNITPKNQKKYNSPYSSGVVIVQITPQSFLFNKGFKPGDIIIKINGMNINNTENFKKAIKNKKKLLIYVIRNRQLKIVNIEVRD